MNHLIIALLLLGQSDQPLIKYDAPFTGRAGMPVIIKPSQSNVKVVKYFPVTPGIEVIPAGLLRDETATIAFAENNGTYEVYAYGAKGDIPSDPVKITITIGNKPGPVPVPPNPSPTPTPDGPDEFLQVLGPIWGALNEPNKIENAKKISKTYRQIAQIYLDTSFITHGQASDKAKQVLAANVPVGVLVDLREQIGLKMNESLPKDKTTILNDELRKKLSSEFNRMANLIDILVAGVK